MQALSVNWTLNVEFARCFTISQGTPSIIIPSYCILCKALLCEVTKALNIIFV